MTDKLCTPGFGDFLPFLSADPLKLCQVGRGPSVDGHFQVSPEMFDWVQVRALAGLLKDIHRGVPKPLLCYLGCVLRVVVLLEGEVLSALDQVFIQEISVLCSIQLSLNPDQAPSPCH